MSAPPTPPAEMPLFKDSRFKPMSTPCERADSYRPGGFHPVNLGDVLGQRYRVIRKLGYGSFGTVWLAIDLTRLSSYIALKIYAANVDSANELSIHQYLSANCQRDANSKFVLLLSDYFTLQGPNGKHICFVTKPMGPSISTFLNASFEEYDPLNPPTRRFSTSRNKHILKSILSGLKFLHDNNVTHGDLQLGNVLLPPRDLSTLQQSELEQNESNSQLDPLVRKDGKADRWSPKYLVVPEPLDAADVPQDEEVIKLIDLGGAFYSNNPPASVVTPLGLRAPETILQDKISPAIDIWSFGCIMFGLLTDNVLFELFTFSGERNTIDDDHLLQLSEIIGPLPEDMLAKWPRRGLYFGSGGNRLNTSPFDFDDSPFGQAKRARSKGRRDPPVPLTSLEDKFHEYRLSDVDAAEANEIASLLRDILHIDPLQRPTAAQLLERPWFRD
ncbi:serine/threonine-protein kinase SRPK3 [Coniochaeta ligniaria NRRL 30616]|uniref:Serine/threonine-protein kinase SRPK3 n=1 Tax=Coniochaeta ligniaria NRRL 30616 TaxID=1408157 RepID=A0A1J7JA00_9PEZI|nr:serine/threonine-protein kinase SRPK3 [Coniochaeta ligniaria NRRL 30616]